ncbi:MAG TPA: type II secretion system protein [Kiritimatiellia bacterium]|nr:type II secretion system protein [Kiritimatiellia bacterium]HPA79117.1 type II secretion system protein [Kiritimatiellia bacterium]HQQ05334.1 type II secretion system protein [Kiritimatiellia bacterium]
MHGGRQHESGRGRPVRERRICGFTLIELLVVIAILGTLFALTLPVISAAREKAKVAKVYAELRQIEAALILYFSAHQKYPPVRVSCNAAEREHWCELPMELVSEGYLPSSGKPGVSSMMEDPFNPGHTYKYAAPGPYYLNGSLQSEGFPVYVPDDFPACKSSSGSYHDTKESPLAWAVWSLGPRQSRTKALSSRAPVSGLTWYRGGGGDGVIARICPREGAAFQTP